MNIASLCPVCIVHTVALLIAANGAPVIARKLFGKRYAQPLDGGLILRDGSPLFGASKTWRGLAAGMALSAVTAPLLALSPLWGALFGLISLAGDLLASFIKRRLGYASSSRARWLDVPLEALLPSAILHAPLDLGITDIAITVAVFFLLEALGSPLLYRLHIRNRPY